MRARLVLALVVTACGGAAPRPTTPEAHGGPSAAGFTESSVTAVHGAFTSALDVPVTSFGAATLDGSLYVAGGYFGEPHRYDRTGQSATLVRLGASGAWEPRASMDVGLQGFAMVAYDGALVRCGGSRVDNGPGEPTDMHSVATCARYVPASDAWEPFAEMPASRSSFDAAVLGGRIYAVGGWAIDGDQEHTTFATEMAIYDGSAWSVEAVPFTRRALAVVATSSAIVAIGGMEGSRDVSTAVDVYDPATHAWTSGPAFPGEGFGMAAAAIGDVVYASGSDGTLWRWSVGEPAWTVVRAMVQPRFFHRLVPVADALWAIGGIGSMTTDGRARLIEAIPTSPGEGASVGWTEISFPGRARNRFAMFAEGDSLYVVGGNDSPAQHDFAPTNFVEDTFRLHLPSLRWFALAPLAEGRQSMEPIRLDDDTVALVGGFGHGGSSARTFADAFVGPDDGAFPITRDVLAEGRTQFGWAVWDGAVWLVAGLVFDEALPAEEQFHHLRDVIRCPITEGAGVPFGPCEATGLELPGTRRAFASARVGSRLYVVGGMREDFAPVDDCAVLDLEARSFSALACPAHVRISATMLEHDGALYLVGGSARAGESLAPDRSIERFDPGTGSWSTVVEELPFDTHQGRWAFAGERLVMLATQAEAGHATLAMVELPH